MSRHQGLLQSHTASNLSFWKVMTIVRPLKQDATLFANHWALANELALGPLTSGETQAPRSWTLLHAASPALAGIAEPNLHRLPRSKSSATPIFRLRLTAIQAFEPAHRMSAAR